MAQHYLTAHMLDILLLHMMPYLDILSMKQLSLVCWSFSELIDHYMKTMLKYIIIPEEIKGKFTEKHLICLGAKTTNLVYLDLNGMYDSVTDKSLHVFLYRNHNLKLLNITRCTRVTQKAFSMEQYLDTNDFSVCRTLSKLEVLIANWCRNLGQSFLVSVSHAPLKVLSIAGTWNTDDTTIADCSVFFKDLKCLNVNKCYKITDCSIKKLSHCRNLRILKISGCWKINDDSVGHIIDECKGIQKIAMFDCKKISRKFMGKLSESGVLLLEGMGAEVEKKWDQSSSYLQMARDGITFFNLLKY